MHMPLFYAVTWTSGLKVQGGEDQSSVMHLGLFDSLHLGIRSYTEAVNT